MLRLGVKTTATRRRRAACRTENHNDNHDSSSRRPPSASHLPDSNPGSGWMVPSSWAGLTHGSCTVTVTDTERRRLTTKRRIGKEIETSIRHHRGLSIDGFSCTLRCGTAAYLCIILSRSHNHCVRLSDKPTNAAIWDGRPTLPKALNRRTKSVMQQHSFS
ncbi:hypothetical protein G7K_0303-t1 [Saitoella complicata NRRL Y-17804]|uniref:Uncharacterized protein n=1 Tax=Saitoella complicata (strain BCRC 22490 / CBS 7301 / JCM 7358 / NBRC 10748 / NRRL Y-17804) TaxID=698492 RepID=A0A0E9N9H2_SAICN|nr:hypothetical protein G7K_0303-t1 [Saitoella complicata NRRL Y-17804]